MIEWRGATRGVSPQATTERDTHAGYFTVPPAQRRIVHPSRTSTSCENTLLDLSRSK